MTHDVLFNVPARSLGKSDIEFDVKADKQTLGLLKISKGSLVWIPKGKTKGHRCTWGKFSRFMKEQPQEERR